MIIDVHTHTPQFRDRVPADKLVMNTTWRPDRAVAANYSWNEYMAAQAPVDKSIVFGIAWAPSFMHTGALSSRSASHLNPLGIELTVDFAVLHARAPSRDGRPPEPHIRVAFSLAPHTLDSQPAVGTLSIGAVWY